MSKKLAESTVVTKFPNLTKYSKQFLEMPSNPASLCLACFIIATFAATVEGSCSAAAVTDQVWPMPSGPCEAGDDAVTIDPKAFKFDLRGKASTSTALGSAAQRAVARMALCASQQQAQPVGLQQLASAAVEVDAIVPLSVDSDESYNISASLSCNGAPCARIAARTQWGAVRGLATFAQMADGCTWTKPPPGGPPGVGPRADNPVGLEGLPLSIADRPRFAHRGLMLDTSRHFLPLSVLRRQIDAMAEVKLNVLHLHISDAQSVPLQVPGLPAIQARAAYHPSASYSAQDLQALAQYALERGVLLLPEIDLPGHAFAFEAAYPNLTANCPSLSHNINNVPLSPAATAFLQRALNATIGVALAAAPDTRSGDGPSAGWMHLGGDEVVSSCWKDDPEVGAWMQRQGWAPSDTGKLYQWFLERGWEAAGRGRTAVHWQDAFDAGAELPADAVVQVWRGTGAQEELAKVLGAGHRALLSNSDKWYLNCGANPSCSYSSWQQVYENEPFPQGTPVPSGSRHLLQGGEAVMFGEFASAADVEPQVWPRAAAAAERLWSPQEVASAEDAAGRMAWVACRLVTLGFRAGPVGPGFCSSDL